MGLDFFEVTLRIEEAFDIKLSEQDINAAVRDNDITVGDLYALVLRKLGLPDVGRYDFQLNRALWLQMQQILSSVTQVPVEHVQLPVLLDELIPRETRREMWDSLREVSPYRISELDYPRVVRIVGIVIASAVVLIELFQLWQMPGAKWLWPVLGIFGCWMVSETYLKLLSVCSPLRKEFPARVRTVKDLCRIVLALNYSDICSNTEVEVDQRSLSVWEQLVEILGNTLGVDSEKVTFHSRLLRDLGME